MGRHRLPSAPTPPVRRRGPRHAARRTPSRLGAPVTMAVALLVAAPGGVALADDPPPAAVDDTGTLLGSALGTDRSEDPGDADAGSPDAGASDDGASAAGGAGGADQGGPVTGADIVDGSGADVEPAAVETAGTEPAGTEPAGTEPAGDGPDEDSADAGETAEADVRAAGSGATEVTLLEKNDSGVTGTATIDAERVVATATGLDPAAEYVSFFYGATSSATNNNPCILDGTNPLPSGQTVGQWDVDEDGNGTLSAPNPLGERYTLQAGTMSIRKVEHDFSTATALPVNPLSYSLVACGEVERLEILDPVTDLVPKLPKFPSLPPLS